MDGHRLLNWGQRMDGAARHSAKVAIRFGIHSGKRYSSAPLAPLLVTAVETRSPQSQGMDPRDALRRAVKSLEDGPADPRTIEGAKVNALESIAWSLIGLLGDRLHADRPSRPHAAPAPDSLSGELRSILGLDQPRA